jgi:hypothetical protein
MIANNGKLGLDGTQSSDSSESNTIYYKYIISSICLLLLLIHLGLEYHKGLLNKLDLEALAIAGVGISPWLAHFFSSAKIFGTELHFVKQEVVRNTFKIEDQQKIANQLLIYSLAELPYRILWKLGHTDQYREYRFDKSGEMPRWMNLLHDNGLIQPKGEDYIVVDGLQHGSDLVSLFKPTPAGEFLMTLRGEPEELRKERVRATAR